MGRLKDKIAACRARLAAVSGPSPSLKPRLSRSARHSRGKTPADQRAQLGKLERTLEGLRRNLSSTRTQLESTTRSCAGLKMKTAH